MSSRRYGPFNDEYDEDYIEEEIIETREEPSININKWPFINIDHETEKNARADVDTYYGYLKAEEIGILRDPKGKDEIWMDEFYMFLRKM